MGANKWKIEIFEIAINDTLSEIDRIVEYGEVNSYICEKAADIIRALLDERERLTKERNAAVEDIWKTCRTCKFSSANNKTGETCRLRDDCSLYEHWEWRGVEEDNDGKTDI